VLHQVVDLREEPLERLRRDVAPDLQLAHLPVHDVAKGVV
jgi:hypothetical protein